jgi:hypothetical protein
LYSSLRGQTVVSPVNPNSSDRLVRFKGATKAVNRDLEISIHWR